MKGQKYSLAQRIETCRNLCTEVSKLAGIAKGLLELSRTSTDSKASYYYKSLLEAQFKQLIIELHVLTLDKFTRDVRIDYLVEDFKKVYETRLLELGLLEDIEREEKYRKELVGDIRVWKTIRRESAAHGNLSSNSEWEVSIDNISIFIEAACNLLNTMSRTVSVPSSYPSKTKFVVYNSKRAVNLEEESYKDIVDHLRFV